MTLMEAPDGKYRPITIGDRLRIARESLGMDKVEFAEHSGISRNTIARYEAEEGKLSPVFIRQWAMATGFSRIWIMTGMAPTPDTGTDTGPATRQYADRRVVDLPIRADRRHNLVRAAA